MEENNGRQLTSLETLSEVLDGELLVLERRAVLVVQPAELLQNFRVSGIILNYALVGFASTNVLIATRHVSKSAAKTKTTLTSCCCSYT